MLAAVDLIHRRDVVPKTAFESSYSRNRTLFDPPPNQSGGVGFDNSQARIEVIETNAKSRSSAEDVSQALEPCMGRLSWVGLPKEVTRSLPHSP
jgi:hypothetical protein